MRRRNGNSALSPNGGSIHIRQRHACNKRADKFVSFPFTRITTSRSPTTMALTSSKSGITNHELEAKEFQELHPGPLSVLMRAVKGKEPILIACCNNKKLLGRVKAFDIHFNMVLEGVKEMWTESPKTKKGAKKSKPVNKDRYIPKMFLKGDSVILIVRNPLTSGSKVALEQEKDCEQLLQTVKLS